MFGSEKFGGEAFTVFRIDMCHGCDWRLEMRLVASQSGILGSVSLTWNLVVVLVVDPSKRDALVVI